MAGAETKCTSVCVVCGAKKTWCDDVRSTLFNTGAFAAVDTFDASYATPSSSQLAAYDAVLVFSDNANASWVFSDPVLLGDRLASYHDQGGGVVVTWKSNVGGVDDAVRLQGAYGTPSKGYALSNWIQGSWTCPADWLGNIAEAQSPLMKDVITLTAQNAFRSTAPLISGRGVGVAFWNNGGKEPLVIRGFRGSRTLVELNFFPVSNAVVTVHDWWKGWTGDGDKLLRNALKYSRCMPKIGMFSAAWGNLVKFFD